MSSLILNKKKFFKNKKKAFTLIELLVVVAIVGILSSVIIASLSSAREKAKITSIKSTLSEILKDAMMTYNNDNGIYTNVCAFIDSKYKQVLLDAGWNNSCLSEPQYFSVGVILENNSKIYYSVSQDGVSDYTERSFSATDMSFVDAENYCASSGKRIPNGREIERLWILSGSSAPDGFSPSSSYWGIWGLDAKAHFRGFKLRTNMSTGVVHLVTDINDPINLYRVACVK